MNTPVILVNTNDEQIGHMPKLEAHQKGLLHRAFSIFIFNQRGQIMMQQRALDKYHSGGLWTNTCCSHPYPDETPSQAATRRMREELGFETTVEPAFSFIYKAALDNELTEYEFDHVLIGEYDGPVFPNKDEVVDYCYMHMDALRENMANHPGNYTEWFKIALPMLEEYLDTNNAISNENH